MGLQASGEISVELDCASTFRLVADPMWLAQCVPGCQDVQELSPTRYSAVLTNKVAYITLRFKVIGEVVRMEPPHEIEVKMTGDSTGVAGHVVATAGLQLAGAEEGRTVIRYRAEVVLTGKLGGLGQPVFRAKSEELAREFGVNLKAALEQSSVDAKA